MSQPSLRTLHIGLGPIGLGIARLTAAHSGLQPIGGLDIAPNLNGRDLGDVLALGRRLDAPITNDVATALAWRPDVALHATTSRVAGVVAQLLPILTAGIPVVSTCEELCYPWFHHPDEAQRLDTAARQAGVAVLATGINPGYAMDALPLALSGVSPDVTHVRCRRVVNLSQRRRQLQQKVGVGYTQAQFKAEADAGKLGHVGLPESVAMLAAGLGWRLERIEQSLQPVVAQHAHTSALGDVPAGGVIGQHQFARGFVDGAERITLELVMALDAVDEAGDFADLAGGETVSSAVRGIQGDLATAAIVVNMIPHVLNAKPGLRTMLDLPMPRPWRATSS